MHAAEAEFAERFPDDVVTIVSPGGELLIKASAWEKLTRIAERMGAGCLGIEGFLIAEEGVYPSMARIVDFSDTLEKPDFVARSWTLARDLLAGDWADPPGPEPMIMRSDAHGEYALSFVIH